MREAVHQPQVGVPLRRLVGGAAVGHHHALRVDGGLGEVVDGLARGHAPQQDAVGRDLHVDEPPGRTRSDPHLAPSPASSSSSRRAASFAVRASWSYGGDSSITSAPMSLGWLAMTVTSSIISRAVIPPMPLALTPGAYAASTASTSTERYSASAEPAAASSAA